MQTSQSNDNSYIGSKEVYGIDEELVGRMYEEMGKINLELAQTTQADVEADVMITEFLKKG